MFPVETMTHLAGNCLEKFKSSVYDIDMKILIVLFLCFFTQIALGETAIFAGGCFWCTESDFEKVKGVTAAVSGYAGGKVEKPTYEQVSAGTTGHTEVVQVEFDSKVISYEKLLDVYFRNSDPLVQNRQFCDHGDQYRTAIFATSKSQLETAKKVKAKLESEKFKGKKVYTQIEMLKTFYPAEDYHQDYYKKNPIRYNIYRFKCGRDSRLEEIWGKPSK